MGQGHPRESARKRDRAILYIAQISVMPSYQQEKRSYVSYGVLYFEADVPPF